MSEDRHALVAGVAVSDLTGFGAVGSSIVKSVSEAIGTVYRPTAIRREGRAAADAEAYGIEKRAQAEARARMIETRVEESIEARAVTRIKAMETRRQRALEATVDEALRLSQDAPEAEARALDEDWTNAFITHAQEITGEDLRAIWARILASQARADAATVSRATLDAVRLLEPAMARQFEAAIRMWAAMGQIMHLDDGPEGMMNLHASEMMALEEIGLLRRYDRNEPNMDFADGVVLAFYDTPVGHGGRVPWPEGRKNLQGFANGSVRIDRMVPTWRGQELAAVLMTDLYTAMAEKDFSAIAPAYVSKEVRLDIITAWAAQVSDRGYLVVLKKLRSQAPAEDDVSRSTLTPRFIMREQGSDWAWESLTEHELKVLSILHPD